MIDPAKVVRSALQNAASIGSLLLSTEAVVWDDARVEDPVRGGLSPEGEIS